MNTILVSNNSELIQALRAANQNTQIELAPGNYGSLNINSGNYAASANGSSITIKSADPQNQAVFTGFNITDAPNLRLESLTLDYFSPDGATVASRPFQVFNSDGFTLSKSTFLGDVAKGVAPTENGYGAGIALAVNNSSNVNVSDNYVTTFHKGFVFTNVTNVNVLRNDIEKMASDGINFANGKVILIEGNHLHNFQANPGTHAHKDMIQFWTTGVTAASQDVIIRNNVLDSEQGQFTQSILIKSEQGITTEYQNFLIENNFINNSFVHGITIDHMNGLTIRNNTVLDNPDTDPTGQKMFSPAINIGGFVRNADVSNNIAPKFSGSYSGSNNLIVQNTDPSQPNYYGNLYVNGMIGGKGDIYDFTPKQGSLVDQMNVGVDIAKLAYPGSGTSVANLDPVATDDQFNGEPGVQLLLNLVSNDSDADGDFLSIASIGAPSFGTATISSSQTVTYVADPGFVGTDGFSYTISDGNGGTSTAYVSVDVAAKAQPLNSDPTAVSDIATTVSGSDVTIDVLANDVDVDGDLLTVSTLGSPNSGTVTVQSDNTVVYTPDTGFVGTDTFTYQISDGRGGSSVATATIEVKPIATVTNVEPIATNDYVDAVAGTPIIVDVVSNDVDHEGANLQLIDVQSANGGTVSITANGQLLYTAHDDFSGIDAFLYRISDGSGGEDSGRVTFNVSAAVPQGQNEDPIARDDVFFLSGSKAFAGNVLKNDQDNDGDTLVATLMTGPVQGVLDFQPDGSFTYQPTSGFTGHVSFSYSVSDGAGGSDNASVSITVTSRDSFVVSADHVETDLTSTNDNVMMFNRANDKVNGFDGNDHIRTTGGDDIVLGGLGNDTIRAGNGDDYLLGGSGHDKLHGGNGNDILVGGAGSDLLKGNYRKASSDTFVFTYEDLGWTDRIVDFGISEGDILDFSDFGVTAGQLSSYENLFGTVVSIENASGGTDDIVRLDGVFDLTIGDLFGSQSLFLG